MGEGAIDMFFYVHLEGVGDLRSAGRLLVCYTFEIHSSLYKSLVFISKAVISLRDRLASDLALV